MNEIEYKVLKNMLKVKFGAGDKDTLSFYATGIEKQSKMFKWVSIIMGVFSIPLCFMIIGIPMLIGSIIMFFYSRKMKNKARMFREHISNDPVLSAA